MGKMKVELLQEKAAKEAGGACTGAKDAPRVVAEPQVGAALMTISRPGSDHISPTVKCIGHLIHQISTRIASDKRILWFRGHRSTTYKVLPTIWRDYYKCDEHNFTNRFYARAATRYQSLPSYDDDAIWLSLMQHYGLPTRLLDWTRSPLIAAYFALEKYIYDRVSKPEDALIWVLEPHRLNSLGGFGEITPSIDAHMCKAMLAPAFTDKAKENGKVMAVMAAEKDIRMFVQQGCFTIHSDETPLEEQDEGESYLNPLRIPAECVKQMAFEIDVCGFRKGDIFPDLGHLADELKACYPRTRKSL
jgi:hypothetical protein